jgi:hypothetical protein
MAGDDPLQSHSHAILVIGWSLLPAAGFGEGAQILRRIGHHDGLAGPLQHIDIVPVIADGHGFFATDTETGGEAFESPSFGDAGGKEVEDGEVAGGIFGADGFAGCAPFAGFEDFFGLTHRVEAAGDHALDGVVAIGEGVFKGLDDFDGVAIGFDPEGDVTVRLFEVFEDELAGSDVVEGEDESAVGPEETADAAGYASFEVRAIDGVAAEGSGYCTIGRNEGHIRSEAEALEERGGVGGAAAGGDGDGDAGVLRVTQGFSVAGTDGLAERGQESAVDVDGHQAHGGMHGSSVPGGGPERGNHRRGRQEQ